MTKEQFDNLYHGKAIHCNTKEKAKEFLTLAHSVGYRWSTKRSLIEYIQWDTYKEETCYEITNKGFVYANVEYYKYYKYELVEYQLQTKFKVDDKVKIKNTLFTDINGKVGIIVDTDLSPMPYLVKIGHTAWTFWLYESQLEKFEEPKAKAKAKAETTQMLIDEIKTKWSEINILLNRLKKKGIKEDE